MLHRGGSWLPGVTPLIVTDLHTIKPYHINYVLLAFNQINTNSFLNSTNLQLIITFTTCQAWLTSIGWG